MGRRVKAPSNTASCGRGFARLGRVLPGWETGFPPSLNAARAAQRGEPHVECARVPRLLVTMRTRFPRLNATPISPQDQVNRTCPQAILGMRIMHLAPQTGPKILLHPESCTFSIFISLPGMRLISVQAAAIRADTLFMADHLSVLVHPQQRPKLGSSDGQGEVV